MKEPEEYIDEISKEIDKISKTALVQGYYNLLDTDTKQRYEYEEKIHIKVKIEEKMSAFKTYTERAKEKRANSMVKDICAMQRTIDYYEEYFEALFLSTRKVKVSTVMKGTCCDEYVNNIYRIINEVNGL